MPEISRQLAAFGFLTLVTKSQFADEFSKKLIFAQSLSILLQISCL
jgi:ABC-type microcin C transport system permease subunit YejB